LQRFLFSSRNLSRCRGFIESRSDARKLPNEPLKNEVVHSRANGDISRNIASERGEKDRKVLPLSGRLLVNTVESWWTQDRPSLSQCVSFRNGYRIIGPCNSHRSGDPATFRMRVEKQHVRALTTLTRRTPTGDWWTSARRATPATDATRRAERARSWPKLAEDRRRAARRRDASNARIRPNGCVQQEKLLCNCCKIRESDWCILLDSAKIKSIHQSGSRILQQL